VPRCYEVSVNDLELLDRIRQLRKQGRSPKAIARSLCIRPAVVTPLVRQVAAEEEANRAETALVGCWVNQGWGDELDVAGHLEWPHGSSSEGCAGLANVVVAREARNTKVSVCSILVDTHCLGVKEAIGPRTMGRDQLADFKRDVYAVYGRPPLDVPLELAQHLVFGAIEFARMLGFEPAPDFDSCVGHLGAWSGTSAIRFGRHGKPMYVAGPYDNAEWVIRTLRRAVGEDNFDYLIGLAG
jgi:hypothetical protein